MYHFQDIADDYDRDSKDKRIFQDGSTILPLKNKVQTEERHHYKYRYKGRIEHETFPYVAAQKCSETPLHTTAGAINTQALFIEASH
jgi:hypothetical protein